MSQIQQSDAIGLLSKLLSERIPLQVFFASPSGTQVSMSGFVDSMTRDNGLVISASGPPVDVARGYVNFFPFGRNCDFWYGDKREVPAESLPSTEARGDSALMFTLPASGERFVLFFTI